MFFNVQSLVFLTLLLTLNIFLTTFLRLLFNACQYISWQTIEPSHNHRICLRFMHPSSMDSPMFNILCFSVHVLFNVLALFLLNSIDSLSFHNSLTGNVCCCEEWQEAQQEQKEDSRRSESNRRHDKGRSKGIKRRGKRRSEHDRRCGKRRNRSGWRCGKGWSKRIMIGSIKNWNERVSSFHSMWRWANLAFTLK
jgi:hypothetical protein